MATLNVGDTVQLKSGGPKMNIGEIQPHQEQAYCTWFDKGKVMNETFPLASIVLVDGVVDPTILARIEKLEAGLTAIKKRTTFQ